MLRRAVLLMVCLGLSTPVEAAPVIQDADRLAAGKVAMMDDASPVDRLAKALNAPDLSEGGLYVLAGTEPMMVDEIVTEKSRAVLDYVQSLPPTTIAQLRSGGTVVRKASGWSKTESAQVAAIAKMHGLKPKKLEHIRIGTLSGRALQFEIRGKAGSIAGQFLQGPTPDAEEKAMGRLSLHFGAKPPRVTSGPGTRLKMLDSSFEANGTLGVNWYFETAAEKGGRIPEAEFVVDSEEAFDGARSLRMYSTTETRYWPAAVQNVEISASTPLVLQGYSKATNVRIERDQEPKYYVAIAFLDSMGQPVGETVYGRLDSGDHDWEMFQVKAVSPENAAFAKIMLACTMSGRAWFDGLSLEVGY